MIEGGYAWLLLAVALGAAELAVPGVFLVFVAIAAAITGVLALLFPALTLPAELAVFGAWSVVAVVIGRRWYADYPVDSDDPLLNDRAGRLIGERVVVVEPIVGGIGRVRLGDGEWIARGPALDAGSRARIVGVSGSTLTVAPDD
ncbi:NfeD family protein [Sphingomonas sp. 2R-10]|uniref:NfeD family protein n=1 Tax=Sphingomonas sp. 2R-10 TaxID=3045148 RepID=UPI000F79959F|nr:NfeD family protein [Sphingomonas sp. 2R-10]MDJ0277109.1 NfeD family protein [Sphingomonas sp. 2R-10]